MAVSTALEKSATEFGLKYACNFNFKAFESNVEEFTFLRPVGGWNDVYKMTFERMYMQALESVAQDQSAPLDSEAMLDDFEYTLIRPYVNEGEKEIKHRPYAGMDRVSRLEYLQTLTSQAPSNSVDLYAKKYKNGDLSLKQMRAKIERGEKGREHYIELAGCVQALEAVNQSRSAAWRFFHPLKNHAEKRNSAQMKRAFVEETQGGEDFYAEAVAAAYEPFGGHQSVNERLDVRMTQAKEELNRKQKMSDAMRESIHIECFEKESVRELSPRVAQHSAPVSGKQI